MTNSEFITKHRKLLDAFLDTLCSGTNPASWIKTLSNNELKILTLLANRIGSFLPLLGLNLFNEMFAREMNVDETIDPESL